MRRLPLLILLLAAPAAADPRCEAQKGLLEALVSARAAWCLALTTYGNELQPCLDRVVSEADRTMESLCTPRAEPYEMAWATASTHVRLRTPTCGMLGGVCGGSCPGGGACEVLADGACGCGGPLQNCPAWNDPGQLCGPGERCLIGRCLDAETSFEGLCGECPEGQIGVAGAPPDEEACHCIDPWSEQACGPDLTRAPDGIPRKLFSARGYCPLGQFCANLGADQIRCVH